MTLPKTRETEPLQKQRMNEINSLLAETPHYYYENSIRDFSLNLHYIHPVSSIYNLFLNYQVNQNNMR